MLHIRCHEQHIISVREGSALCVYGLYTLSRISLEEKDGAGQLGNFEESIVNFVIHFSDGCCVVRLQSDGITKRNEALLASEAVFVHECQDCQFRYCSFAGVDNDRANIVERLGIFAGCRYRPIVYDGKPDNRL